MLGNLIGGFVVILVGVTLAPTVANEVRAARGNASTIGSDNITGAANTILGLTTLFYCLAIASAGIGIATVGLRNAGLM
jgi:xanthine/uracil permease